VLAWPGMPARDALAAAGQRLGKAISVEVVVSNEALESRLSDAQPFDLIFPSDYLVERLTATRRLHQLDHDALPLERRADWALTAAHDAGCHRSVPFAFGTTGYLCRLSGARSWSALFDPPSGTRVGMLEEVREVVGAALIATGHGPNDVGDNALGAARALLERQRPHVARYDSDDFVSPIVSGAVGVHHAWSGPAAHGVREHSGLRYVVPEEGAILWITTAAIPVDAPDPAASLALVAELMDPELAAQTTIQGGFATPNEPARALLPAELRADNALFPDGVTLARCHLLRDLGDDERRLAAAWKDHPVEQCL
jgi:spermidine/putrescine transport system substrate-binding protein